MDRKISRIGTLRPERLVNWFSVYAPESSTQGSGRERVTPGAEIGRVKCLLTRARAEERERYHQMRVEISHVLTAMSESVAYAGCTLVPARGGQRFRVRAVRDIGGLGLFTAYDCEEIK